MMASDSRALDSAPIHVDTVAPESVADAALTKTTLLTTDVNDTPKNQQPHQQDDSIIPQPPPPQNDSFQTQLHDQKQDQNQNSTMEVDTIASTTKITAPINATKDAVSTNGRSAPVDDSEDVEMQPAFKRVRKSSPPHGDSKAPKETEQIFESNTQTSATSGSAYDTKDSASPAPVTTNDGIHVQDQIKKEDTDMHVANSSSTDVGASSAVTKQTNNSVQAETIPRMQNPSPHQSNTAAVPPGVVLMTKDQHKYCTAMIRSLKRHRDAGPFLRPVDIVALNIPDYPTIVKHPTDLSTIEKKLKAREYTDTQGFTDDLRLMFNNCYMYNGRESVVGSMASNLESMFETQLKKMPPGIDAATIAASQIQPQEKPRRISEDNSIGPMKTPAKKRSGSFSRPKREAHPPPSRDLPNSGSRKKSRSADPQMKFCMNIVKDFVKKTNFSIAYPFLEPVDPISMSCPDYFDVIKEPMDLSTIKKKLDRNEYNGPLEFEADMRLMFRNCYAYNPPGHPVHEAGRALETRFDQKWVELPSGPSRSSRHQSPALGSYAVGGTAISHSPPVGGEDEFDKHVYGINDEIDVDSHSQGSHADEIRDLELKVQTMARQLEELKRNESAGKRRPSGQGSTPRRPSISSVRSATRSPPLGGAISSAPLGGSGATSPGMAPQPTPSGRGRGTAGRRRGSRGRGARSAAAGMTREEFAANLRTNLDMGYSPTASGGRGRGRRRRGSIESLELTLDQKRALSSRIEELSPNRLRVALMIIKSAYPDLNEDEEEIELDIDSLDHYTLRKLYEYVVLDREEAAGEAIQRNNQQAASMKNANDNTLSSSSAAAPVQPSAYPKPNEADQRRISQLDEKLKRLDSGRQYQHRGGAGRSRSGVHFDSSSSGESGSSDSEDSALKRAMRRMLRQKKQQEHNSKRTQLGSQHKPTHNTSRRSSASRPNTDILSHLQELKAKERQVLSRGTRDSGPHTPQSINEDAGRAQAYQKQVLVKLKEIYDSAIDFGSQKQVMRAFEKSMHEALNTREMEQVEAERVNGVRALVGLPPVVVGVRVSRPGTPMYLASSPNNTGSPYPSHSRTLSQGVAAKSVMPPNENESLAGDDDEVQDMDLEDGEVSEDGELLE